MSLFAMRPYPKQSADVSYPDYYVLYGNKFNYVEDALSTDRNSTGYGALEDGETINCGDKFNKYDAWGKKDTYAVDDIVKYQGRLYKCTQSTQSAPAFAPQSWSDITATTLDGDIIRGIRTIEIYFECEQRSYYDDRQDTLDDIYFNPISFRHIDTTKADCISPSTAHSDWLIGFMVPKDEDSLPTLFLRLSDYDNTQFSSAEEAIPVGESGDSHVSINIPMSMFRSVTVNNVDYYMGTVAIVIKSDTTVEIYVNGVSRGTYIFYNYCKLPPLVDVGTAYKSFDTDVSRESTQSGWTQNARRLALYDRILEPGELRQNALYDATHDSNGYS